MLSNNIHIVKRNGSLELLNIENIRKQTIPACEGLGCSYESLELSANISFTADMKTSDVQKLLIQSALSKVDVDAPNWAFVAARLKLYSMYHELKYVYHSIKQSGNVYTHIPFFMYIDRYKNLLSYSANIDKFDIPKLDKAIKPERDLLFTYLAIDTLEARYLMKHKNAVVELPQHMWMSLAMFLAQNEENPTERAIEFYDVMSKLEYLPATPTLANGRKLKGNCFSCAVGSTEDNIESIFDAYKAQAIGSKNGSGWGWDWTRVRALGGEIQGIQGAAGGLVPWLKIENGVSIAANQLGTRLGAINVSVESWHLDIFDFLDLKKNGGEDKRRAKELFITVSCSDEFMRRVRDDESWTLFDPNDVSDLPELHNEAFTTRYKFYETQTKFTNQPKVIKAKDLWKRIQMFLGETGLPFIFFKDAANRAEYVKPDMGLIRSANLCMEYLAQIQNDEITLCNLGSINLSRVNTTEDIDRVVTIAMRMLDNVIDVTTYPIPNSEVTQKLRRSVGLGIAGEAEMVANKQIMYGTDEHIGLIHTVYKNIAEASDKASMELAVERGAWRAGEKYRNYVRRAIAPTSTIALIMGTSASHEPVFDKVWVEENAMGTFKVTAPNVNSDNFQYYINAYDVDQKKAVLATAVRQQYIDMGISHNMYFRPETTKGKDVFDTYLMAWDLNLKTVYYYRSKSMKLNEVRDTASEVSCVGCAS